MVSARRRAEEQLTQQLRAVLSPAAAAGQFVLGTHTRRFADNLLPTLTQCQVEALHGQLAKGSGNELRPTKTGRRPAHAPYSSAALAINAFGRWLGSERWLSVSGVRGFSDPLIVEAKRRIAHGGGVANLDVLLAGPELVVGIESKLTETLSAHKPVAWKTPYRRAEMAGLLQGGWRELLDLSLSGRWAPSHIGVEQLVKHALAINSYYRCTNRHLIYCYWEPTNATDVPEVCAHRAEVARCAEILAGAEPNFMPMTYNDLFLEWEALPDPQWMTTHVAALRARYDVAL